MSTSKCMRHPRQEVVGICASCLKERLLALVIEEEDLQINARDPFAYSSSSVEASQMQQMDNNMARQYVSSSHHPSFNIFTDSCKASSPSPSSRRHGLEYDREDVRHVASLYQLQRHHSVSSSPLQKQALKFPSPLLTAQYKDQVRSEIERTSRDRDVLGTHEKPANVGVCRSVASTSTPRKKKGSLWSLLHRYGRNESSSSTNVKELDMSNNVELHRKSLQHITPTYAQRQLSDEHYKLSYRRSGKGSAQDVLSGKDNAYSSLLSSSKSFQSTLDAAGGTASSRLLSPASSRHCTPLNPLQFNNGETANRDGDGNIEPFSEDGLYHVDDDANLSKYFDNDNHLHHGSKSWISSLFPRKGKYASTRARMISSAGISSSHVYATHVPSRRESVSASPRSTTPRRKSVSFLDDHVAARTPISSNSSRPNASQSKLHNLAMDITRDGAVDDHKSLSALRDMCRTNVGVVKADRHGYMNAKCDAASRNNAYYLSLKSNSEQLMKSPRLRIANPDLPKRSNKMGMDCTRDMRVSPSPISLKQSQQSLSERYGGDQVNHTNVGLQSPAYNKARRSNTHVNPDYEGTNMGIMIKGSRKDVHILRSSPASSPLELQRRTSALKRDADAEFGKDVDAIRAQYMEMYKEKEEDSLNMSAGGKPGKSSWGALAWNKTLSPMLGLRGKKKKKQKAKESCSSLHDDNAIMIAASNEERLHNNVIDANDGISAVSGLHHCGINYALNGQESECQSWLGREIVAARKSTALSINHELLLSPEAVLTPEHRRPPQHYSFLNKDYSAFSYYFSPARSSSCSNASNGSSNISTSSLQSNNSNTSSMQAESSRNQGTTYNMRMKMMTMMGMGTQGERRRASVSGGTAIADQQSAHHHLHHQQQQQQSSLMGSCDYSDIIDGANVLSSSPPRHSVDGACSWTSYPSLFKQQLLPSYNGR